MNYYIDFEATQYSGQIIEIGCVDENGRKFSSLVKPKDLRGVTNFITNLTGITKEDISNAPTAEKVFSDFLHWVEDAGGDAHFFTYGGMDYAMLRHTGRYCESFVAMAAILAIANNTYDTHEDLSTLYPDDKQAPTLTILYKDVVGKDASEKAHRALNDAEMLMEICMHEKTRGIVRWVTHREYEERIKKRQAQHRKERLIRRKLKEANEQQDEFSGKIITVVINEKKLSFNTLNKAARWVLNNKVFVAEPEKENEIFGTIKKNIKKAISKQTKYCGANWSAV